MARAGLDRQRVVDAAAAMADADGLEATTLSALARSLGVQTPSLYKHVASRPALVELLAIRAAGELTDAIAGAATGRSGPDAVRAAADAWRDYAHTHPGLYAAAALQAPPTDASPELHAAAGRLLDALAAVLRAWSLADGALVDAIRGLRAGIHGYVALERAGGFELDRPVDASFAWMIDAFIAALGAPGLTTPSGPPS